MRSTLALITCHLALSQFGQAVIDGPWHLAVGASNNTFCRQPSSYNIRIVSPRFKWSDYDLSEAEEKHADDFKNTRLMVEVIYRQPLKVLCTSLNVQSRFIKYKRFSLDIFGGMKFFVVPGPDFSKIPYLKKRQIWYMNIGLLAQLNLGVIAPFADIGGDGVITVGSEFNFHAIYRKTKKRYKLRSKTHGNLLIPKE